MRGLIIPLIFLAIVIACERAGTWFSRRQHMALHGTSPAIPPRQYWPPLLVILFFFAFYMTAITFAGWLGEYAGPPLERLCRFLHALIAS